MVEELTLFPFSSLRCTSGHHHTKMQRFVCLLHLDGCQEVYAVGRGEEEESS